LYLRNGFKKHWPYEELFHVPIYSRYGNKGELRRSHRIYLEIDRTEIDDYLAAAGFGEENYAKIAAA